MAPVHAAASPRKNLSPPLAPTHGGCAATALETAQHVTLRLILSTARDVAEADGLHGLVTVLRALHSHVEHGSWTAQEIRAELAERRDSYHESLNNTRSSEFASRLQRCATITGRALRLLDDLIATPEVV